jgi:hypothetical protein
MTIVADWKWIVEYADEPNVIEGDEEHVDIEKELCRAVRELKKRIEKLEEGKL